MPNPDDIQREAWPGEPWTADDGLTYTPVARQNYTNGKAFSAGTVEGHPVDTLYLDWGSGMLLLRPDEAGAIVWVLGYLLSVHLAP